MAYNPYGYPGYTPTIVSGTADIQGVPWVSTIDEVRSAPVFSGKQMFMDRNANKFYVKDQYGNMKAFEFTEVPLEVTPDNYVTKQEFEELRSKYEQLVNANWQPAAQPAVQPVADAATAQYVTSAGEAGVLQQGGANGNDPCAAQPVVGQC